MFSCANYITFFQFSANFKDSQYCNGIERVGGQSTQVTVSNYVYEHAKWARACLNILTL